MCDKNPLLITPTPSDNKGIKNPKGRPRKTQSVTFSSQPRSLVSQMIEKMITDNKIDLPIKCNSDQNITSIDKEDPTDESHRLTPTKKHFSKSVEKQKEYSCDFANCVYSSKLSSNLHKHKRTHTSEKPYLCDRCSFRTNFSNSLKVHRRLHTAERPYKCTNCEYKCNSISNLKKHCHTKHAKKKMLQT